MGEKVDDVEDIMRKKVEKMKLSEVRITEKTPLASKKICLLYSSSCDWKRITGFNLPLLEKIIMQALTHYKGGYASKISGNEAILLTIIWLRSGFSFAKLADPLEWNAQIVTRAVIKGLSALSFCFEDFTCYTEVKPLLDIADVNDIEKLSEKELLSQYIIDGKHFPIAKVGREVERPYYCSYKLKHIAYQAQFVITHTGLCVSVSRGEKAGEHDMKVYYDNRRRLIVGLYQMIRRDPIIMGDQGYLASDCPEIITSKSQVFNKYRILIERYFGRMSVVFAAVGKKFPLSFEHFSLYVRTLSFLTNVHVFNSPLVRKEERYHYAMEFYWQTRYEDKILKHRESVKKSRENSKKLVEEKSSKDKKDSAKTGITSSPKRSPVITASKKLKGLYFVLSVYLNMSSPFKVGK